MQYRNRSRQAGFTLVEIAIVLVIIGLLLGGVLKGQEVIENARIKNIVSDMKGVQVAFNSYFDRYRAVPGDEVAATLTGRGWAGTAAATVVNGVINGGIATTFTNTAATEQPAFWRSLRGSGLIGGDPAAGVGVAALPTHSGGGVLGVNGGVVYGLRGPVVCASGLTAKQAAGVDALFDGAGAANNTGDVRAASAVAAPLAPIAAAPVAAPYDESAAALWTVCMSLV